MNGFSWMYVFIVGLEKCGTTSLADWMISHDLAQFLINGKKEPHIFTTDDFRLPPPQAGQFLLDASTGYALHPGAMGRLPKRFSKVVMCIRNPLQRAWSSFKFKKLISQKSELVWPSLPPNLFKKFSAKNGADLLNWLIDKEVANYPISLHASRRQILEQEWLNIRNSSFLERIKYEMGFVSSFRFFPIINILEGSFFNFPLRNVSNNIPSSNLWVLDINALGDQRMRNKFAAEIFERPIATKPLPKLLNFGEIEAGFEKPDFTSSRFDEIKSLFRDDLSFFFNEIDRRGISSNWFSKSRLIEGLE